LRFSRNLTENEINSILNSAEVEEIIGEEEYKWYNPLNSSFVLKNDD